MTPAAQPPRPWLVFADDWGRHPSSCQHLVRHVLPHREVVWVNTIGTRPPRLDLGTAKRVVGKLKEWLKPMRTETSRGSPAAVGPQPRIVAPKMWPSFKSSLGRGLNRRLLVRSLRPVIESLSQPPVVVTTLPLVADLVGRLPVHRWVYYCVDDFSVWPGYDGETLLRMERDLVPKADEVIAVSETLVKYVGTLGKSAKLLTHGVDLDHWHIGKATVLPETFDGLQPPFVVFWGVIDRRMDLDFVKHLSANLDTGTIVLIGPREDPHPELLRLPRVAIRPPVPFAQLPAVASAASVLVMPYIDAPVTRAMQPLKLKEYMATGRPVVVRDLPSTRPWADCVDVAATAERFTQFVKARLSGPLPSEQQRSRQRLESEGWAEKAATFEKWVRGE